VKGKNRTTFTRMMQLDIEYARKKSLRLDLQIMVMTGPALLVQMWDLRQQRKAPPGVAPAPMAVRATNN
jgi:lipopolysaccharide/colanic/teichoic acid biosynthesis glycosyltransferase